MNKNEKMEGFRIFFRRVQVANAHAGLLEKIERFITGSTLWCLRRRLEDRRLGKSLDQHGEFSFETKRQRDRCDRAELGCRYGQPLNRATESRIAEERFDQVADRDIRLLIANRIINPKKGGEYEVSIAKERFALLAGWTFVFLCITAFGSTAAMIWVSPAGLLLKAFLTLALMAIFFIFAYSMSCYGILPFSIIKRIE